MMREECGGYEIPYVINASTVFSTIRRLESLLASNTFYEKTDRIFTVMPDGEVVSTH